MLPVFSIDYGLVKPYAEPVPNMIAIPDTPRFLSGFLVFLGTALVAWSWNQQELLGLAVAVAACGLLWLAALWQQRLNLATPCFILLALINLASVTFLAAPPSLGLISQLLLLGAWDLSYLASQVALLASTSDVDAYITRHLIRLGIVLGIGLILGMLPLRIGFAISFVPTLLLTLVSMLVLYWVIGGFKKLSDP